jgi:hypothetical protein
MAVARFAQSMQKKTETQRLVLQHLLQSTVLMRSSFDELPRSKQTFGQAP